MDWQPFVGQLVCCIDDAPTNAFCITEIERGTIYTVRAVTDPDEFIAYYLGGDPAEIGLMLEEVRRERIPDLGEVPFRLSRFRPLDPERIAIFRRLLAPVDGVPA
ncbi:hypothetical protein [Mesorhizobium sp. B2-4-6]|uniref:hypothetical protein n=1 Tax=Mesorhizobium sp. B2-4-6 TaxID=2589943 RepID=UPI001126B649|nr:hypothetical protein [Mesorhizobium sp. B2-4-6]TPL40663.1 hypothetical protein FJ957_25880 [Mesorhizobium sp. B2-4-6]